MDPATPAEENPTRNIRSAEAVGIIFLIVTNFATLGKLISKGGMESSGTVSDAVAYGIPLI